MKPWYWQTQTLQMNFMNILHAFKSIPMQLNTIHSYDTEHNWVERWTGSREIYKSIRLMVQTFAFSAFNYSLCIFVTATKLSGLPQKMKNKIPWLFPDHSTKFPDHFSIAFGWTFKKRHGIPQNTTQCLPLINHR